MIFPRKIPKVTHVTMSELLIYQVFLFKIIGFGNDLETLLFVQIVKKNGRKNYEQSL